MSATERVACLICASDRTAGMYRQFDQDIVGCRSCGFVYVSPRPTSDAMARQYDADYFFKEYLPAYGVKDERYDAAPFTRRFGPLLAEMARRIGGPGRLLEVGAAAGFFLKEAEKAGWQAVGVEIMDAAIEFATRGLGLDVRKQSAEELRFPEASFDAVAMLEVLEHLHTPRETLAAVREALRPGGILVITTPNFGSLTRWVLGSDWAVLNPGEHLSYFTPSSLSRFLAQMAFDRIEHLVPQPGFGPAETINAHHSFHPASRRTRAGVWLTRRLAPAASLVQRAGLADSLVVIARRP